MKRKISIIYSWFIKLVTCFLPNIPVFMRFRGWLYSLMMKKCGKNFQVASTTILTPLSGIKVGNNVYIAHYTVLIGTDIEIGDEVLIGPNCIISSSNHSFHEKSYRFGARIEGKILIKNGCWIGGNCSLVMGAILPERSILAAGAVLTQQMDDVNSTYAGNPTKKIK